MESAYNSPWHIVNAQETLTYTKKTSKKCRNVKARVVFIREPLSMRPGRDLCPPGPKRKHTRDFGQDQTATSQEAVKKSVNTRQLVSWLEDGAPTKERKEGSEGLQGLVPTERSVHHTPCLRGRHCAFCTSHSFGAVEEVTSLVNCLSSPALTIISLLEVWEKREQRREALCVVNSWKLGWVY